jgi:hypothetical protein
MENRMDTLEKGLSELNAKFKELGQAISSGFVKIDHNLKLEDILGEITKIGKVTGYEESFKNLEGLN